MLHIFQYATSFKELNTKLIIQPFFDIRLQGYLPIPPCPFICSTLLIPHKYFQLHASEGVIPSIWCTHPTLLHRLIMSDSSFNT